MCQWPFGEDNQSVGLTGTDCLKRLTTTIKWPDGCGNCILSDTKYLLGITHFLICYLGDNLFDRCIFFSGPVRTEQLVFDVCRQYRCRKNKYHLKRGRLRRRTCIHIRNSLVWKDPVVKREHQKALWIMSSFWNMYNVFWSKASINRINLFPTGMDIDCQKRIAILHADSSL